MDKIYLDAGMILAANDRPTIEFDVPEWGGIVRLRPLSAADRERHMFDQMRRGTSKETDGFLRCRLVQCGIVGESGKPIFDLAEVQMLGDKSQEAIESIALKILEISGMLPPAVDAAEKNSEAVPIGSSSSVSLSD